MYMDGMEGVVAESIKSHSEGHGVGVRHCFESKMKWLIPVSLALGVWYSPVSLSEDFVVV